MEKIENHFHCPEAQQNTEPVEKGQTPVTSVLDNYDLVNENYTKGIDISQCTFSSSHHFSIWEFSGYEPYKIFYDNFIGDSNCIHLIVYNLNQTQNECFKQCVYWLEYLRSRISVNKPASHVVYNESVNTSLSTNMSSISSNSSSPVPSQTNTLSSSQNHKILLNNSSEQDSASNGSKSFNKSMVKILFAATHADLDKTCVSRGHDGQFISEKANTLRHMLEQHYHNDDLFDLSEKHFVLDARAAWEADIKVLIQSLVKHKQGISERLPRCTMFLNRTLFHLQNWRKSLMLNESSPLTPTSNMTFSFYGNSFGSYPVMGWRQFVEQIRESINPLASDDHLNELVQQLQLMGEIVYIEGSCAENDMICYQPEWLCNKILGRLFSHQRYFNVKPENLNGIYRLSEIKEIYADLCTNVNLLKDIFIAFDLCAECEHAFVNGDLCYEFAALNFLSEPLPLAFRVIKHVASNSVKQKSVLFVFNGFQIRSSFYHLGKQSSTSSMSSSMTASSMFLAQNDQRAPSQLANLFFRIQVYLRHFTANFYNELEESNHKMVEQNVKPNKTNQKAPLQRNQSKLDTLFETAPPAQSSPSSYPTTANSTINILQSSSKSMRFNSNSKKQSNFIDNTINPSVSNTLSMSGALIDTELYQTRYCSRLSRKSCLIECLLSLDHVNGEFIELRACAPEAFKEELFYFVQDLYSLIEQIVLNTCPNINLEKHYLSFRPVRVPNCEEDCLQVNLGAVTYESVYSPKDVIKIQSSKISDSKLVDLICCGSENINKNLVYGVDLSLSKMSSYTRRILCNYLDKVDPMGRDWSILAFLLGLQDFLPLLDNTAMMCAPLQTTFSKCDCVLNEWSKQKGEQANLRNLLGKINDLGRKDVHEMILNTICLYQMSTSKDSGIQNSNQTLASLK